MSATRGSTFPRIRHMPGSNAAADDLGWSVAEAARFLDRPVVVVEKLDGVNVTFERVGASRIAVSLKRDWQGSLDGALLRAVQIFARQRHHELWRLVKGGAHFHGEWMLHRVSMPYRRLPDVFVGTSLMDRRGRFMDPHESIEHIREAGLAVKEPLFSGVLGDMARLRALAGPSEYDRARMEGLIVCIPDDPVPHTRWAKWVGPWYRHPRAGVLSGARNLLSDAGLRAR